MNNTTTAFQNDIPNFVSSGGDISTLSRPHTIVRVPKNTSDWIIELQDRFEELTSLPKGWDGYAGKPVSFNSALFAANLIERLFSSKVQPPQLVPGSDGTLQIEWHQNQLDIEIDVLKPYMVNATYFNHITGEAEEIELQRDFSKLSEWIIELGESRNNQQELEKDICVASCPL